MILRIILYFIYILITIIVKQSVFNLFSNNVPTSLKGKKLKQYIYVTQISYYYLLATIDLYTTATMQFAKFNNNIVPSSNNRLSSVVRVFFLSKHYRPMRS